MSRILRVRTFVVERIGEDLRILISHHPPEGEAKLVGDLVELDEAVQHLGSR